MDVRQKFTGGEWWVARKDLDALLRDVPPGAGVDPEKLIAVLNQGLVEGEMYVEAG
jgi:hypothetical protein